MKILVLNSGSSSIKYQLIDMGNNEKVLAKGLIECIGEKDGAKFKNSSDGKEDYNVEIIINNHEEGINLILNILLDQKYGAISDMTELSACGHRVVHGGEKFKNSIILGDKELDYIAKLSKIAPLHNPGCLLGIKAVKKILPNLVHVGVFDTAFHQTMSEKAFLYGIPYEYYEKYKVRRYGFHGTSHKFVSEKAMNMLNENILDKKIITCHLGNGASLCAINKGKSMDTSMGFTPVEGLIMGTRSGDIDIGAFIYIAEEENMDFKEMNNFVNKRSGLFGITGGISDMREIEEKAQSGDERYKYALDILAYRVKKYIGSYIAAMNGVDYIIMTGGLGENSNIAREMILSDLDCFGIEIDPDLNIEKNRKEGIISKQMSKVCVMIVKTNEELVIARDTYMLIK